MSNAWSRLEVRGTPAGVGEFDRSMPQPVVELLDSHGTGRLCGIYAVDPDRWAAWQTQASRLHERGFWAGLDDRAWKATRLFACDDRGCYLAVTPTAKRFAFYLLAGNGAVIALGHGVDELLDGLVERVAWTYATVIPGDGEPLKLGVEACYVHGDPMRAWLDALVASDADALLPDALGSKPLVITYIQAIAGLCITDGIPDERRVDLIDTILGLARRREPRLAAVALPAELRKGSDFAAAEVRAWAAAPTRFDTPIMPAEAAIAKAPVVEPLRDMHRATLDTPWFDVEATIARWAAAWTSNEPAAVAKVVARCRAVPATLAFGLIRQVMQLTRDTFLPGRVSLDDWQERERQVMARLESTRADLWPFAILAMRSMHADAARHLLPVLDGVAEPEIAALLLSLVEDPHDELPHYGYTIAVPEQIALAYLRTFKADNTVVDRFLPVLDRGPAKKSGVPLAPGPVALLAARIDDMRVYEAFLTHFERRSDLIGPALAKRSGERTKQVLRKALKGKELATRISAARALVALGDPEAGPTLARLEKRQAPRN